MNKFTKGIATLSMALIGSVALAGCGETKVLYTADLNTEGFFGLYGTVQQGENSVVLKPNEGQNYSASTYFGEEDRNFDWNNGGMTVELSINLDASEFDSGDYSVWSLALNETDGSYITESAVFFVGTTEGVKFIYKNTGVDTDYEALAQETSAATLGSGEYKIKFDYNVKSDNTLQICVSVVDEANNEVYSSGCDDVLVIDHDGYTSGEQLNQENVGGLRYLWLVRTSVNMEVIGLRITE